MITTLSIMTLLKTLRITKFSITTFIILGLSSTTISRVPLGRMTLSISALRMITKQSAMF